MARRTLRDRLANAATSLAEIRPKINALMMYHFLYDSLGTYAEKKLSTKLEEIKQDGPTLLKMVLMQTFIATKTATYNIKEEFYDLNLKKFKWNVIRLNQHVREKCADLVAAGTASDETDIIISLFRAYKTSSNDEFNTATGFWKNLWEIGRAHV